MNMNLRSTGVALIGAALSAIAAPAAYADDNCMQIRGRAVFANPTGVPNCSFEGEAFDFCIEGRVRGTLRGSWTAYGKGDWFVDLPASEFPVPEDTLSNYNREFNVFSTRRGTLIGDSQYVFDIRIFDVDGGFVTPIIIDRGTGIFEGATGWIAGVLTDGALSRAVLLGEVCGPHVPADGDEDSD